MRKPAPRMPLPALLTLALVAPSSGCTRDGARSDAGPGSAEDTFYAWDANLPDSALPGFDATCESIVLRSTPTISNVLVVLDRSSSMYREAGFGVAGVDRWNPAVAAIQNVTTSLDDRVQFGLMLFANPDAPAGMTLCGAGKIDVAPAPDTGPAIAAELTGDPNELTGSWTPTAVSLDAARTALAGLTGRSYVLLVTDGAPNCNSGLDGARCRCGSDTMSCSDNPRLCIDEDRTVPAVAALPDVGHHPLVVGPGASPLGGVSHPRGPRGGGPVSSGTSGVSGPPDVGEFGHGTLEGVDVPHESVATGDGSWALVDEHFVELRGSACAALRDGGEHDLAIRRECQPLF